MTVTEQLLKLPEKPGTVIAIGAWWLVRLRPYEDTGAPSAWELLPMPSKATEDHATRQNVKTQCIYDDAWVLAEAEQEGGYLVISDPRDTPSGVQYFKPSLKVSAAREEPRPVWDGLGKPPIGARVRLRHDPFMSGEVVGRVVDRFVDVRWSFDGRVKVNVRVEDLEPQPPAPDPLNPTGWTPEPGREQ